MSLIQEEEPQAGIAALSPDLSRSETAAVWNDWGATQFARGNLKESERAFHRALELDENARQPAINLGMLLLTQGRSEEGIALLARYMESLSEEERQAIRELTSPFSSGMRPQSAAHSEPPIVRELLRATPAGEQYRILIGRDHPVLSELNNHPACSRWPGVVIDHPDENAGSSQQQLLQDPVSVENIIRALEQASVPAAPGLLTVNDHLNGFHLVRAVLQRYQPRIVAVGYNAALGDEEDRVVPYLRGSRWDGSNYYGASYRAWCTLAEHFDYRSVDCDDQGIGLFLVRKNLVESSLSSEIAAGFRPGPQHPQDEKRRRYLTSDHYLMEGVRTLASSYGYISYFANDEYIGRELASGRYWDAALVQQIGGVLHSLHGVALDIGAHIGTHAVALAHLAPQLKFICFEPQLPLFRLLERNVYENGLGYRIQPIWSAVAHTSGQTTLSMSASDGMSAGQRFDYGAGAPVNLGGIQLGAGGQECRLLSVDDLQLSNVRYVKMDVEGAEPLVLAGMKKTLETSSPIFLYEERGDRHLPLEAAEALKVDVGQLPSVTGFLSSRGYHVQRLGLDWLAMPPAETDAAVTANLAQPASIPARIFQTWKSKQTLPSAFERWSSTFKLKNPGFIYNLWDDDDNRRFIAAEFPWFLNTYNAYKAEIYRADAVRYFYLYTFGGVYADMDTECLRSLDGLLHRADVILGRMGPDPSFPHSIPNAIMASRPRQEFWVLAMGLLLQSSQQAGRPEALTGPILLKSAVDLYRNGDPKLVAMAISAVRELLRPDQQPEENRSRVEVLKSRELYPIDWSDPIHQLLRTQILSGSVIGEQSKSTLFPNAWMVTYWSHSWEAGPCGVPLLRE